MNWKHLNAAYLENNPNVQKKKYYEVAIKKYETEIEVHATKSFENNVLINFNSGDDYPRIIRVKPPNWFERFRRTLFIDKVLKARRNCQRWCDKENWKIYEVSQLNV